MIRHRFRESVEVAVERALEFRRHQLAIGGGKLVDHLTTALRHGGREAPRHVRGDHRPAVLLGEFDQWPVVRPVTRPGTRRLQHLLLAPGAGQICVDQRLYVPLEHFERHRRRHAATQEAFEQGGLESMGVGVVVLLADEHDVGCRRVGDQRLEVRQLVSIGDEDSLGNVPG